MTDTGRDAGANDWATRELSLIDQGIRIHFPTPTIRPTHPNAGWVGGDRGGLPPPARSSWANPSTARVGGARVGGKLMLWEVSTIEPLPPCRIIAVCIHRAPGGVFMRRRRQVVVDAVVVEATISSCQPPPYRYMALRGHPACTVSPYYSKAHSWGQGHPTDCLWSEGGPLLFYGGG